jgi:hypothetical protein
LEDLGFQTYDAKKEQKIQKTHKNMGLLPNGINPNLFKQVLDNETKAQ